MGKKSKKSGKGNPKSEGIIESCSGDTSSSDKPTSGDDSSEIAKFEEGFDNFSFDIMSVMEDIFGRDLVASGQAGLQEILQKGKAEGIANCRLGRTNLPKILILIKTLAFLNLLKSMQFRRLFWKVLSQEVVGYLITLLIQRW